MKKLGEEKDDAQTLGMTSGGQMLNVTKTHFQKFLTLIVTIAKLQVKIT